MKKTTIAFLFVNAFLAVFLNPAKSQIDSNFYSYRDYFYQGYSFDIDTNEGSLLNHFKKFEYINGPNYSPTGSKSYMDSVLMNWISDYEFLMGSTSSIPSNWSSIGPNNTPTGNTNAKGVGRLICIALDTDDPNNKIYVGSPFGGVWKTDNGGINWANFNTDFLPVIKISDIAINPNNNNIIYIATGDRDDQYEVSISAGVYRSADGGLTWSSVNNGLDYSGFFQISKILINPSNPDEIFLSTSEGIYKTTNGTTSCQWIELTDPLVYQNYFRSIIYKPNGLYTTLYASGKDILKSTDGGNNWNSMTGQGTGLDFSTFSYCPSPRRINLAVSPNAPEMLFAFGIFSNNNDPLQWNTPLKYRVFIHDGISWSTKDFLPGNYESGGGYSYTRHGANPTWLPITVSPVNEDHIYIGNVVSWRSFDGGNNWNQVYTYSGQVIHPDCHDLKYSPDGQTLYVASDGGFSKISNPATSDPINVTELNNGLTIGTITKIALTNKENELTLIGEFDCGSSKYDPLINPSLPWNTHTGGDGGEQEINFEDSEILRFLSL